MGKLTAMAMSDEELGLSLETQIEYHLSGNHYPPVPKSMVSVCIEAIDNANAGDWNRMVRLPEGTTFRGYPIAPTHEIVDQHHLYTWIIESEFDDE